MTEITRRTTLLSGLALAACAPPAALSPISPLPTSDSRLDAIERRVGGRIGVAAWNTGTNAWLVHRAQERFAMCSTFKWLLAAHMLSLDMRSEHYLARLIPYGERDIKPNSPVTTMNLTRGSLTVRDLCRAAITVSDNTAANLLLGQVEGPEGFTRFLRENGDAVTRLDRFETELNENLPGDERDTTTPDAMARTMQRFLATDDLLNAAAREILIGWLVGATTGLTRLRAGLPADWRVGDKTGASEATHNANNDVAIAWPPGRAPIIIASYMSESAVPPEERNAAHAEIGRIVAEDWG